MRWLQAVWRARAAAAAVQAAHPCASGLAPSARSFAGHSKWANIKHKKGAADAKRAKLFAKVGHEIAVAARGGADPVANAALAGALARARAANMPKDRREAAVARGAGGSAGDATEEITLAGKLPNGVAVAIDCLTDKRTRTLAFLKKAFKDAGGQARRSGAYSRFC